MMRAKADAVIISFSDFITHSSAQLEREERVERGGGGGEERRGWRGEEGVERGGEGRRGWRGRRGVEGSKQTL